MEELNMSEDEIQILGQDWPESKTRSSHKKVWLLCGIILVLLVTVVFVLKYVIEKEENTVSYSLFSDEQSFVPLETQLTSDIQRGYVEMTEKSVNDVPLLIYIPYNAEPVLTLGLPDETDSTVVFVAQAADVGADGSGIIGDFVLAGERLARGTSKNGFCAIVNRVMTIGAANETPLLQDAILEKGYFFRQYSLVKNSVPVDNKPRGKALRKALAIRDGQVMMIASRARESFYDFAQALADAGVSDAIYLIGSDSFGWYIDRQGKQTKFGTKYELRWKDINYLVWRAVGD
jgi:hypothetical protein